MGGIYLPENAGRRAIVMKARLFLFSLIICSFLFFSGCLDCERYFLSIDLANRVVEVRYGNIVSNSKDEDANKKDFLGLIKEAYFDDDSKSHPDRITQKRLYRNNDQLDGIVRFSFRDLASVLKEFEIQRDKSGNYFVNLTKDIENYQISGNGQYVEGGEKKLFKWPKHVKEIKIEMKAKAFNESEKTRLLKPWQDWVDKNTKE